MSVRFLAPAEHRSVQTGVTAACTASRIGTPNPALWRPYTTVRMFTATARETVGRLPLAFHKLGILAPTLWKAGPVSSVPLPAFDDATITVVS
jgi:hypothetical protein